MHSLEEMLKEAEECSQGNESRYPAIDRKFLLELISLVRERLFPKLPGEGGLPELDEQYHRAIKKLDLASVYSNWNLECAKVECRERQLLASQARERDLESSLATAKAQLETNAKLIEGLQQENGSQRAHLRFEASWQRDGFWRWQGDETDELESLTCAVAISAPELREIVKRAETVAANTRAECLQAVRGQKVENTGGYMTRAQVNVGLARAERAILALDEPLVEGAK